MVNVEAIRRRYYDPHAPRGLPLIPPAVVLGFIIINNLEVIFLQLSELLAWVLVCSGGYMTKTSSLRVFYTHKTIDQGGMLPQPSVYSTYELIRSSSKYRTVGQILIA